MLSKLHSQFESCCAQSVKNESKTFKQLVQCADASTANHNALELVLGVPCLISSIKTTSHRKWEQTHLECRFDHHRVQDQYIPSSYSERLHYDATDPSNCGTAD